MKKISYIILLTLTALHVGCGDPASHDFYTTVEDRNIASKNACVGEDCELDLGDASLKMVAVELTLLSDDIMAAGSLNVSISCNNVFGTSATGDWTQSNVTIATTGATPDTANVSIISGKACTITINSYTSGASTWNPSSTALPIAISTGGVVTASGSAYTYSNGTINEYFTAYPNGTNAALIYYTVDPTNSAITLTTLSTQAVALTIQSVPAPSVSNVALFAIPSINGSSGTTYTFAATASASGTLACRYLDNTSSTVTPTSWTSVNSFFAGGTGGTACPAYTPPSTQGNWTSIYNVAKTYLVVFGNTVNNLTSYVTYSVP